MDATAYLAGVVRGDGWCTALTLGLRVADYDFALAFAEAILEAFGRCLTVRRDERGYWLVRTSNKAGCFNSLIGYTPANDEQRASWLKGYFDSEGNASLIPQPHMSLNSYQRRIAFYSTNVTLLAQAEDYLTILSMATVRSLVKRTAGHKGDLPVFELRLRNSLENFRTFGLVVSSHITRKRLTLEALPRSYQIPGEYHRRGQRQGADAKHRKTMTVTLPAVVAGIRALINQGIKPTQRNCRAIPGYTSVQPWVPQAELVRAALAL